VQKMAELSKGGWLLQLRDQIWAIVAYIAAKLTGFVLNNAAKFGAKVCDIIAQGENDASEGFGQLARSAINDMFGVDVDPAAMTRGAGRGAREPAANAIGAALLTAFSGQAKASLGGELHPTDEPAKAFLSAMAQMALEGWLEGWVVEALSVGQLETFGDLDDTMSHVLGLGRASAAVHGPIVKHMIVTPLEWKMALEHRPELLGQGEAIRHFLRGGWTRERLSQELGRQGVSEDRIDILISNATKRLTVDQLLFLNERGVISDADLFARCRDLGYDDDTATNLLKIETTQRLERLRAPLIDAVTAAYIAGDVDESELTRTVTELAPTQQQGVFEISNAKAKRLLRRKNLSSTDERRLTKAGIRSVADYRAALARENYDADAIDALELELRKEIGDADDLAAARAQQKQQQADDKAQRDADAAARKAEIAARNALPALAEYRSAYVHGLITRETFGAAIQRAKDGISPADLEFLLADADKARDGYLTAEDQRKEALARNHDPQLPIATLEAAVIEGVLTVADFDSQLAKRKIADDDRRVLVALLQDRIGQRAAADKKRADAAAKADAKGVPLATFERAVRLGIRSVADYAAYLDALDTADVDKALILDLLGAEMQQDADARKKREARDAAAAEKGISLAQRRRAYIAGVADRAYYEQSLIDAGWPVDDRAVEMQLADLEAADAADARAKRADLESRTAAATVTLAQMERAVKLNLASTSELRTYLTAKGYSGDDAELIVSLVVADVPDVRAGQQLEQQAVAQLASKDVSLADRKALVRKGLLSIEEYGALLGRDGYGADDVALLVELQREEIGVDLEGLRKRVAAQLAKAPDAPGIDEVDSVLSSGDTNANDVGNALAALGVDRSAAVLYARLVTRYGTSG